MWCCQLVSDTTAAGVQHQPDLLAFVQADLDEVVARAERTELGPRRAPELLIHEDERGRLTELAGRHLTVAVTVDGAAPTDARRDAVLDERHEPVEVVRQLVGAKSGLGGDHSAADVDAHGGGDDRAPRGDHGPDSRTDADVCVRHESDVAGHERQTAGLRGLIEGALLYVAAPAQQLRGDVRDAHGISVPDVVNDYSPIGHCHCAAMRLRRTNRISGCTGQGSAVNAVKTVDL
jgi:hypothetical protein